MSKNERFLNHTYSGVSLGRRLVLQPQELLLSAVHLLSLHSSMEKGVPTTIKKIRTARFILKNIELNSDQFNNSNISNVGGKECVCIIFMIVDVSYDSKISTF